MDRFRVIKEIGTGAYSKVYLGERLETHESIIVKKIDFSSLNEKEKELINSEISIIRRFDSPYIVRFIESFNSGLLKCLILEYCNKGDLYNEMNRMRRLKEKFTEESIFQWTYDVLRALETIHRQNVIHRDLKPENIFLHKEASGVVLAKVGDFGLSRALTHGRVFANTFAGTPLYMAPELVQSQKYTSKVDIWSLGCIIYELCTFQPAFNGTQLNRIMNNIVNKEVGRIGLEYSRSMQLLVDRMLVRGPSSRPSASSLLLSPFFRKYRVASEPPSPATGADSDASKPPTPTGAVSKPALTPGARAASAAPTLVSAASLTSSAAITTTATVKMMETEAPPRSQPTAPSVPESGGGGGGGAAAAAAAAADRVIPAPQPGATRVLDFLTGGSSESAPRPFTFGTHCARSTDIIHHPAPLQSKSAGKIRIGTRPTFVPTNKTPDRSSGNRLRASGNPTVPSVESSTPSHRAVATSGPSSYLGPIGNYLNGLFARNTRGSGSSGAPSTVSSMSREPTKSTLSESTHSCSKSVNSLDSPVTRAVEKVESRVLLEAADVSHEMDAVDDVIYSMQKIHRTNSTPDSKLFLKNGTSVDDAVLASQAKTRTRKGRSRSNLRSAPRPVEEVSPPIKYRQLEFLKRQMPSDGALGPSMASSGLQESSHPQGETSVSSSSASAPRRAFKRPVTSNSRNGCRPENPPESRFRGLSSTSRGAEGSGAGGRGSSSSSLFGSTKVEMRKTKSMNMASALRESSEASGVDSALFTTPIPSRHHSSTAYDTSVSSRARSAQKQVRPRRSIPVPSDPASISAPSSPSHPIPPRASGPQHRFTPVFGSSTPLFSQRILQTLLRSAAPVAKTVAAPQGGDRSTPVFMRFGAPSSGPNASSSSLRIPVNGGEGGGGGGGGSNTLLKLSHRLVFTNKMSSYDRIPSSHLRRRGSQAPTETLNPTVGEPAVASEH